MQGQRLSPVLHRIAEEASRRAPSARETGDPAAPFIVVQPDVGGMDDSFTANPAQPKSPTLAFHSSKPRVARW